MNDLSQAKAFVYKKLSQKAYCSHELKKLLIKSEVLEELINPILLECTRFGYINDEEYLENFIRISKLKKLGPEHIIQKLLVKGFERETIKQKLRVHDLPNERIARIRTLLETRYKSKDLTIFKERQKVIASLVRKGFSLVDIRSALINFF